MEFKAKSKLVRTTLSVYFVFICMPVFGITCVDLLSNTNSADKAWDSLRQEGSLVNQQSIPGRDNLCGYACAINSILAAGKVDGIQHSSDPQAVFEKLVFTKAAPEGGLDLSEQVARIKEAAAELYPSKTVLLDGKVLEGIKNVPSEVVVSKGLSLSDFRTNSGNPILVISAVFDANGNLTMQHSQVLKQSNGSTWEIVDGTFPEVDLIFEFRSSTSPKIINNQSSPELFLTNAKSDRMNSIVPIAFISIDLQ